MRTNHVLLPPQSEGYTYDSDGNLTGDGLWSYTWNAENRLVHLVSVAGVPDEAKRALKFAYDFQGRRVSKVVSNYSGGAWVFDYQRKYVYDGWNLLAELDGGNTVVRSYMWGADLSGSAQGAGGVGGLLAVESASDGTQFVAYDGNGNVMGLVDGANGTLSARYEDDPFGQTIRASGEAAESCPFGFSTKYKDEESQFLYYGYRYYNPSTGRWLSRDPIEERGGQNLHSFVFNDPLSYIDGRGEAVLAPVAGWIGGDLAIPEPTDGFWPKFVFYGVVAAGAAAIDYFLPNVPPATPDPTQPLPPAAPIPVPWTPPNTPPLPYPLPSAAKPIAIPRARCLPNVRRDEDVKCSAVWLGGGGIYGFGTCQYSCEDGTVWVKTSSELGCVNTTKDKAKKFATGIPD